MRKHLIVTDRASCKLPNFANLMPSPYRRGSGRPIPGRTGPSAAYAANKAGMHDPRAGYLSFADFPAPRRVLSGPRRGAGSPGRAQGQPPGCIGSDEAINGL